MIDPAHAGRAALGAARGDRLRGADCTSCCDRSRGRACADGCTGSPRQRKFAVELRISLAILFTLAAVAVGTHVSIMLAGFAFGLVVAAIGEPRRLAKQLFALTEGFLGPLFFVWLGASLDVRDLAGATVADPARAAAGGRRTAGAHRDAGDRSAAGHRRRWPAPSWACRSPPPPWRPSCTCLGPGEAPALILGALVTVVVARCPAGSRPAGRSRRPAGALRRWCGRIRPAGQELTATVIGAAPPSAVLSRMITSPLMFSMLRSPRRTGQRQFHGPLPHRLERQPDGGQGRAVVSQGGDVVEAGDLHVVRHRNAQFPHRRHRTQRHDVVHREQAHRPGLCGEDRQEPLWRRHSRHPW